MTDINLAFTRMMLKRAHENIHAAFPGVHVTHSGVIGVCGPHGRDQYWVEIRVPGFPALDAYYSADNRYEARYQAWMAFFDKYAPEQIKRRVDGERKMRESIFEVTK